MLYGTNYLMAGEELSRFGMELIMEISYVFTVYKLIEKIDRYSKKLKKNTELTYFPVSGTLEKVLLTCDQCYYLTPNFPLVFPFKRLKKKFCEKCVGEVEKIRLQIISKVQ
jgi:hypothetical protein